MNRHFKDAQYHLGRTVRELRSGLSMTAARIRARVSREADEANDDVSSVVRARVESVREKADELRRTTGARIRSIRRGSSE